MLYRVCKVCKVEKPVFDFPAGGSDSYRRKTCKACRTAARHEWAKTKGDSHGECQRCGKVFKRVRVGQVYCGMECNLMSIRGRVKLKLLEKSPFNTKK